LLSFCTRCCSYWPRLAESSITTPTYLTIQDCDIGTILFLKLFIRYASCG
jgi:hypothetical protein